MTPSLPPMLVRAFVRRTLSVRYLLMSVVAGLIAFQYLQTRRPEMLGALGMLLLLSSFPFAAVELVAMDRDGRLDQLRLAGWLPGRMLSIVVVASAGPWMLAGGVLLLFAILTAGVSHFQLVAVAVLPLGSLALSMAAIATRATRLIDTRIATAGVSVAAMLGASLFLAASGANPGVARVLENAPGFVNLLATLLLALELGVLIAVGPLVRRLVQRPIQAADAPDLGMGLTRRLRRWCPPTWWRGVTLTALPALVLSAIAVAILTFFAVLWWVRVGDPSITMTWLTPAIICVTTLFFGAGVISGHCREDAEVGRLHLLRLSSDRPLALVQTIGSLWLPFLLCAVTIAVVIGAAFRVPPWYLPPALLVIVLLGPLAAVEGWCRYLPFGLVLPAGIFVMVKVSQVSGPTSTVDFILCLAALGWIPWVMARATLRDPEHPFIRGLAASPAVAGVAFAVFWPQPAQVDLTVPLLQALVLSVLLVHGGSWLAFPSRLATTHTETWGPPVAVGAVIVAVLVLAGPYTTSDAVIVAAIPAAALWIGRRIHESLVDRPKWSVIVRAVFVVGGIVVTSTMANWARVRLDAAPERLAAWVKQQELATALAMLALVVLVEVACYLLLRRHKRIAVVARR